MYETLTAYYFDADDENPSCGNCDNCNSDDEVCEEIEAWNRRSGGI